MRARFVNEEKLGSYSGQWGAGKITVFKNPKSIKRMSPWARAFSDQFGNFYIADEEFPEDQDRIGTTHTDFMEYVQTIDRSIKTRWDDLLYIYVDGIGWQRGGKTNKFYLSESYMDGDPAETESHVEDIMKLSNFFKPADAEFVLDIIDTLQDYDNKKPFNSYVPKL